MTTQLTLMIPRDRHVFLISLIPIVNPGSGFSLLSHVAFITLMPAFVA
jgi:hypothetical protein